MCDRIAENFKLSKSRKYFSKFEKMGKWSCGTGIGGFVSYTHLHLIYFPLSMVSEIVSIASSFSNPSKTHDLYPKCEMPRFEFWLISYASIDM